MFYIKFVPHLYFIVMQTVEFTNITKHNTPYLYPYELSITTFNHYVELGILNLLDK